MWSSELDREVDPLEVTEAGRHFLSLMAGRELCNNNIGLMGHWLVEAGVEPDMCKEAGEAMQEIFDILIEARKKELEILSNLGEGDEYALSNAHRRPSL